ncbi:MAG: hypothetical protein ABIL70_03750 [candidate division WOR-3 bacterium]
MLLWARIESAEGKFKEAIKIFEELKQLFGLAKACYYYGEMLKSHETKRANQYLQKAKEIFKNLNAKL